MIKKSYKIILRKDKQRPDGTCPIYLQIIINREVLKKAINEYVSEKFWDAENGKVKKGYPNYVLINEMIDHKLTEIRKIINSLEISGQKVSVTIINSTKGFKVE